MRRYLFTPLLAVALTGCSLLGQDTPCTQADADSQVSAVWRPADFGGRHAATIRLCVDDACEERASGDPEDPFMSVSVRLADDIEAAAVPVRLRVEFADGRPPLARSSTAKLTEQHPNGAACSPTVRTATYRVDPVKGLTSPKGMSLQ
ncbi:lipoprotein [Streptomyces sp. NPDC053367]|uniref:lipoprotein n=1 Tax=Streptomyces sp. NPDC053367 TaxID=3365700 RepID=UPI0037D5B325